MPNPSSPVRQRDWPINTAALLELGSKPRPENFWTVNDAFQGTQVFGATGSGKSSGSGKAIATAFLESNFGGLVLTAKNDEREEWIKLADQTGRAKDIIVFSPDSGLGFNFLKYELQRTGRGAGHTESLVNLFCAVMEVADRGKSGANDGYWMRACKQLLRNAIDLMVIATGDVNLSSLYRIITTAPSSLVETKDPEWQNDSICYALIEVAEERSKEIGKVEDYEITRDFWLREYPNLSGETRSCIVSMFTTMADCFLRGMLRDLFCTTLDITPEETFKGKIIILDIPVKEFHELGIFSQVLFKYIWQRAVERRVPSGIHWKEAQETIRPVFLWADESQFFVNQYDSLFQSTARSSRACTVYLTQNLPGYQAAFASAGGKPAAESFLGNLLTRFYHANGDPQTNNWAADSIGRTRQLQVQSGLSQGEQNRGSSQNAGGSMTFEYMVQPQEFTILRTGGVTNKGIVDSIVFQGGRQWLADEKKPVGRNFLRHSFTQPEQ
jgi:TraM recognition site of TraD and TraG